jgi:hypothetical protein
LEKIIYEMSFPSHASRVKCILIVDVRN